MEIAIALMVIGIIIIVWAFSYAQKQRANFEETIKKLNLPSDYGVSSVNLGYLGGHPRMTGIGRVTITAAKGNLLWTGNSTIKIPLNTIKKVDIKNERQVTSDVALRRLLLTGVFALAWKKKTIHEDLFLIFEFEEHQVPYTVIFQGATWQRELMVSVMNLINRNLIEMQESPVLLQV